MVELGQKSTRSLAHLSLVKPEGREDPTTGRRSLLRGKFCELFAPIERFLSAPNPYPNPFTENFSGEDGRRSWTVLGGKLSRKSAIRLMGNYGHWGLHEEMLTRDLVEEVVGLVPDLASGDPKKVTRAGIDTGVLGSADPETVMDFLAGYDGGFVLSPRKGLMATLILIDQIENSADPGEFEAAVVEYFSFLRNKVEPHILAHQMIDEAGGKLVGGVPDEMIYDAASGLNLSHFIRYIDILLVGLAYDVDFDAGTFERMAREWECIPGSLTYLRGLDWLNPVHRLQGSGGPDTLLPTG